LLYGIIFFWPAPLGARRGSCVANHLYGDNLDILRAHIREESVDLDPPFNSNAN
jgi:hypothetical protein